MPTENDMSKSESVEGFVLAGGRSARMGRDKAFLRFRESTFLENALEVLRPVCLQVSVVFNQSQGHLIERLPAGTLAIFDIFEHRGALAGIHSALRHCHSEYALILACDMPFVTPGAIGKLVSLVREPKSTSAVVPAQPDGRVQPLCAVYRVEKCLPKLEEVLSKDVSISAGQFLGMIETKFIRPEDLGSDDRFFANVNSSVDYELMIAQESISCSNNAITVDLSEENY